jgi:hypothetical protein
MTELQTRTISRAQMEERRGLDLRKARNAAKSTMLVSIVVEAI